MTIPKMIYFKQLSVVCPKSGGLKYGYHFVGAAPRG